MKWSAILLLGLCGCGGASAANLAKAHIDTLSNGAVRVMSDGPTAWSDSTSATLTENWRFQGEEGTPSELGDPRSLAVDTQGRVYVVDSKPATIKVFTPDGKLVRSIGHEGEGPGEFRVGFIAIRDDHLVLQDPQLSRTTVWDTAGTYLRSWHSSCCYWSEIQVDKDNLIYIPTADVSAKDQKSRGNPYVRWTLEGVVKDTIWVPSAESEKYWTVSSSTGKGKMMMSTGIPFMPSQIHALHPEGGVIYAWTGTYSLVRSMTGHDSARVFGRNWTPEPLSDAERHGAVEKAIKQAGDNWDQTVLRAAFKLEDVPTKLPAFLNLHIDQSGRVWARRYSADTTSSRYDVFDSTGAYLGPVTVPLRLREWGTQAWTRDGVVTVIEDEEGRPTVVSLRVTAPRHARDGIVH